MTLYKLTTADGSPLHGGSGKWSLPRGKWPGAWRKVTGKLVPCKNGLHLVEAKDIIRWSAVGAHLWVAEARGERIDHGDKVVVREARLLRLAAILDARTLRHLAADFAEHVLPIYEAKYPDDDRPRKAIEVVRRYADGEATEEERRTAADAAAYADAADAAYSAADAADAAYSADAAADAATAAYADAADAATAADAADAATAAAAAAADAAYADAAYSAVAAADAADADAADAADAAADAADAAYAATYAARQGERDWQTAHVIDVLGLGEDTP